MARRDTMLGECAVSSWSQYTGAQSSRGGVYPRPKKGKPRDSSTLACSMERFPVRKKIRLPLLVYSLGHPFFITATRHRKHPWFALHPRLCKAAIQILRHLASVRETSIYAWCIMPDHAHLLLQDDEVVEFIRMFKGRMTPAARKIESDRRFGNEASSITLCAKRNHYQMSPVTFGKTRSVQH